MAQYSTSDTGNLVVKRSPRGEALTRGITLVVAAAVGVTAGVAAALAIVVPVMKSEFAAQSSTLEKKMVAMAPADSFTDCTAPAEGGFGGEGASTGGILGSSTSQVPVVVGGGEGGGVPGAGGTTITKTFVTNLTGGVLKNVASIEDTGPKSTNIITASNTSTTTTTNTNDISVSNDNSQTAVSGNTNVRDNTTAGEAESGDASNANSTSMNVSVTN